MALAARLSSPRVCTATATRQIFSPSGFFVPSFMAASHSAATAASSADASAAQHDDTGKMCWHDLSAAAGTSRRPTSAANASTVLPARQC